MQDYNKHEEMLDELDMGGDDVQYRQAMHEQMREQQMREQQMHEGA